jgi:hypothetical protein
MPFKPGVSGNPRGRAKGARDFRAVIPITLNGKPAPDSLEYCAAVIAEEHAPTPFKIQAAAILAPYQHSRRTARYIGKPVDLVVSTNVDEATANIAKLGSLAAAGTIGLDEMGDLVNAQRAFIEARMSLDNEARLARIEEMVARLSPPTVEIEVSGGLPTMPGCENLIMPERVTTQRVERPRDEREP